MSRTAVLTGLGAHVPPQVVTNDMLAERLQTTDEWIRTRTGIAQRHVVEHGTATSDLAVAAGLRALASAGSDAVDMVVLATTTPDRPCPATAPEVAARLGLGDVPAFDIAAVCSGFVYALGVASGAIAGGIAERVLVIGAETFSSILDPHDRTTVPIFGDGAGAVVLRAGDADEPGALLAFDLGSDGSLADLISIPGGGSRERTSGGPDEPASEYFQMQGRPVFAHAVRRMATSSRQVLAKTGWDPQSVDWVVAHQANVRILRAVADEIDVPRERAIVNLDRVGNTSAASIPLALADTAAAGGFDVGDRVLLTAFGGGATWGSATLTWPALDVAGRPDLAEPRSTYA
jgi:3-oxoacyl-[acyl-carrier-protein] synthase-3